MDNIINYLSDEKTKHDIIKTIQDNLYLYQGINTEEKIQSLSGSLYNYFATECVHNNQYASLSNATINKINLIYRDLILSLRNLSLQNNSVNNLEPIVSDHRNRLIEALRQNTHSKDQKQIFIPCSEYTGEFQVQLLRLKDIAMLEPMIDIGCGRQHQLITYLRTHGYEKTYGIDQYASDDKRIFRCNWFDFNFHLDTWGTVLAHMSFSNHFRRSILNQDEERGIYQEKYHEILNSLISGGCFIYSPSLRCIENGIDTSRYSVTYYPNLKDRNLDTVCVRRPG